MQEKIIKIKKILEKTGNWRLFKIDKDEFVEAFITLEKALGIRARVCFQLSDNNYYNLISIMIIIDNSKRNDVLELINDLNQGYAGAGFCLIKMDDNQSYICRKCVYTANLEEFDPILFYNLFLTNMKEFEEYDIKRIMQVL